MELKDQVCSLELAKRLKELGVRQESLFCWDESHNPAWLRFLPDREKMREKNCPAAYTAAELGEILRGFAPWEAHINDEESVVRAWLDYLKKENKTKNEADGRAKFTILLIEEKLLIPKAEARP